MSEWSSECEEVLRLVVDDGDADVGDGQRAGRQHKAREKASVIVNS